MAKPLYDDGVYTVSAAIVSTPRRFYPLAHTTASVRNDPFWAAGFASMFGGTSLAIYGDLLSWNEQIAVIVFSIMSLVIARSFAVLRISAIGHNGAMIIGRSARIHALYLAIREARVGDAFRGDTVCFQNNDLPEQ